MISIPKKSSLKLLLNGFVLFGAGIGLVIALSIFMYQKDPNANASSMKNFDAGNIMSDAVMANKNTMTQSQIQSFLDSKNRCKTNPKSTSVLTRINAAKTYGEYDGTLQGKPYTYKYNLNNGKFICLADQKFGNETAARIIYRAAQDYSINPQVLLVLLEKEAGLLSDNWPNYNHQYATATGYGCPDSGPNNSANCNSNYFGFKNQIRQAANMFSTLLKGQGTNNYPVGNNYIQYNPNSSCGGSTVNVKNRATGALYTYTPYQPNKATREVPIGVEAHCGAYGNKNFYLMFNDWFGSTTTYQVKGSIGQYYDDNNIYSALGYPTSDEIKLSTGGVYQQFEKGRIYWKSGVGAWAVYGSIGGRYMDVGSHASRLGLPVGSEIKLSTGGVYQQFEKGRIYWKSGVGAWAVYGSIGGRYMDVGSHASRLGLPVGSEIKLSTGGVYQQFEKGRIYWKSGVGAWDTGGSIGNRYYTELNGTMSALGYPVNAEEKNENGSISQQFEKGRIYWTGAKGTFSVYGEIGNHYKDNENNLGLPTSNEIKLSTGGVYQQFEKGRIYWKSGVGAWTLKGSISSHYAKFNRENGVFKYPASSEKTVKPDLKYQDFEGGRIYWIGKLRTIDVRGSIGQHYIKIGSHASRLGLPVGSEIKLSTGGVYQQFEKGRIYWKSGVGAWDTGGSIGNLYQKLGADKSKLGYPAGPENGSISTSIVQKYQKGTITYKSGKVTYKLN